MIDDDDNSEFQVPPTLQTDKSIPSITITINNIIINKPTNPTPNPTTDSPFMETKASFLELILFHYYHSLQPTIATTTATTTATTPTYHIIYRSLQQDKTENEVSPNKSRKEIAKHTLEPT